MENKSKVIYVTSRFPFDNWETWALHEIEALLDSKIEVLIIPRTGFGEVLGEKAKKILQYTYAVNYINFSILLVFIENIFLRPKIFLKYIKWIVKHSDTFLDFIKALVVLPKSLYIGKRLKGQGYKHIHAFSTTSVAVISYILSQELNVSWSITFHSSWHLVPVRRNSTMLQIESVLFVRTISNLVKVDLIQFVGNQYQNKIKVIHLGIKCLPFKKTVSDIKPEFNLVSVGYLLPHKGIDLSIIAAKELIKAGLLNFRWTIYGDGPLLNKLLQLTQSLNLEENIKFAGRIDNKKLLIDYENFKFDVLIQNSVSRYGISEGIPVSIMEAMAYGIPVIASDCGGTKELVDGISGILIPQNDSKRLASEIIKLLNDNVYLEKIGQNGREKVHREFNSKHIAKELIEAFNFKFYD